MPLPISEIVTAETFVLSMGELPNRVEVLSSVIRELYVGKSFNNAFIVDSELCDTDKMLITCNDSGKNNITAKFKLKAYVLGRGDILLNCKVRQVENTTVQLLCMLNLETIELKVQINCSISSDKIVTIKTGDSRMVKIVNVSYFPFKDYVGVVGEIVEEKQILPCINITANCTDALIEKLKLPQIDNGSVYLSRMFGMAGDLGEPIVIDGNSKAADINKEIKASTIVFIDCTSSNRLSLYRVNKKPERYVNNDPGVGLAFAIESYANIVRELKEIYNN